MRQPGHWVLAKTSLIAHLDLGERSAESLRVLSSRVIVTACRAHIDAAAKVVLETHQPKCSNCQRIVRQGTTPPAVPDVRETQPA